MIDALPEFGLKLELRFLRNAAPPACMQSSLSLTPAMVFYSPSFGLFDHACKHQDRGGSF